MRDAKQRRVRDISGGPTAAAWRRGYGVVRHQSETRTRIAEMVDRISSDRGDGVAAYSLLAALDRPSGLLEPLQGRSIAGPGYVSIGGTRNTGPVVRQSRVFACAGERA